MTEPSNVQPIRPDEPQPEGPRLVGRDIEPLIKVRHREYGTGHITVDYGHSVQIYWDRPFLAGLADHLLLHDRTWVQRLERNE